MERITVAKPFGGYCYGPADLKDIELGDGYVRLLLQDSAGRALSAVYQGCVHWPITQGVIGRHFAIVQEMKALELARPEYRHVLIGLQKNGTPPEELLQRWDAEGYRFYLHVTNERDVDYLVAARKLVYQYENVRRK